jgi:hypothetical protein
VAVLVEHRRLVERQLPGEHRLELLAVQLLGPGGHQQGRDGVAGEVGDRAGPARPMAWIAKPTSSATSSACSTEPSVRAESNVVGIRPSRKSTVPGAVTPTRGRRVLRCLKP